MFTEAYNITPYLQFPGAWPRTTSGTAPGSAGPDPLVFHYTPGPYHCILDKSLCGVNKVIRPILLQVNWKKRSERHKHCARCWL